ncbi:hypothetical protein F0L17_05560 [Streptomyces sp. TRM43335]|uniref:Septum formation-related domain-containing protein n=1 Tax=Streptomyces taklimakanensis TaxID=2569853 RepID=A0A6G2B903_9ACTN|nr:hypothetical protein [Streptomyces taklimakanensis]MTE18606.1 hypothetical protein [Streptomyces taklimakanensis]
MSHPPPSDGAHNPAPGGGFGPPQGFGPPERPGPPAGGHGHPGPPASGYGYPGPPGPPGPGGPPGYGPGGLGPYFPPPGGGGGGNGGKVAAIIIAAVLVAGLIVGGVLVLSDGGTGAVDRAAGPSATSDATTEAERTPRESEEPTDGPTDEPTDEPTDGPTEPPSSDPPSPDLPPDATVDPGEVVRYVVLEPGTCFDHPSLSSDVTRIEERSCDGPHNAEVISNGTLTGDFDDAKALQDKAMEICRADAEKRMERITDGKRYYFYVIYPTLTTYEYRGKDEISCSLTLSNTRDGTKLRAPLPG